MFEEGSISSEILLMAVFLSLVIKKNDRRKSSARKQRLVTWWNGFPVSSIAMHQVANCSTRCSKTKRIAVPCSSAYGIASICQEASSPVPVGAVSVDYVCWQWTLSILITTLWSYQQEMKAKKALSKSTKNDAILAKYKKLVVWIVT